MNQRRVFAIVGVCLILGGCANNNAVVAQAKPPEPCKQSLTSQVTNQAGYRQLSVRLESGGDAPAELSQGDLKIHDGDQDISVEFFQREAASVGILVDTSGSMEPKMIQAKTTLTAPIDGFNPDDQAFLMAFSSRPLVLQPFTNNHVELKDRLDLMHAFGQTLLRDSVISALKLVSQGCNQNRALFVMTDGMDNTSSTSTPKMIAAVKESQVPVFVVGIGRKELPALSIGPAMLGSDANRVDVQTLRLLAETSGGKWYVLPMLGDAQAKQTGSAIANEIDNEYVIGFIAPPAQNSKIQIELLNHPGATLKIEGAPPDVSVVNSGHPEAGAH